MTTQVILVISFRVVDNLNVHMQCFCQIYVLIIMENNYTSVYASIFSPTIAFYMVEKTGKSMVCFVIFLIHLHLDMGEDFISQHRIVFDQYILHLFLIYDQ